MKAQTVSSCLVPMILCGLLAESAHASLFHLMQIEQVIGGVNGDTTAQAIQLRMRGSLQIHVDLARIRAFDANGLNPITVINIAAIRPLLNGSTGDRVLIVSANFGALTDIPMAPDFTMTNLIPASYLAAGSLTFESDTGIIYWRLSWGGASYTGSTLGFTNDADGDFGPPYPNPLPSGSTQALLFQGTASALSTTNAADYALTPGVATFTNNAGIEFTLLCQNNGQCDDGNECTNDACVGQLCSSTPLPCVWDIDLSGDVRVPDLIKLLSCWGPLTGDPLCACLDTDGSGDIRVPDLIALLAKWGVCP